MMEFAGLQQLLARNLSSLQAFLHSQDINNMLLIQSSLQFREDLYARGLHIGIEKALGALRSKST